MASDDQEVEAWYLEGWCFYLMAEQAKETGQKMEDLTWEELAKDSRDCLETCKAVGFLAYIDSGQGEHISDKFITFSFTLGNNIPMRDYWSIR